MGARQGRTFGKGSTTVKARSPYTKGPGGSRASGGSRVSTGRSPSATDAADRRRVQEWRGVAAAVVRAGRGSELAAGDRRAGSNWRQQVAVQDNARRNFNDSVARMGGSPASMLDTADGILIHQDVMARERIRAVGDGSYDADPNTGYTAPSRTQRTNVGSAPISGRSSWEQASHMVADWGEDWLTRPQREASQATTLTGARAGSDIAWENSVQSALRNALRMTP